MLFYEKFKWKGCAWNPKIHKGRKLYLLSTHHIISCFEINKKTERMERVEGSRKTFAYNNIYIIKVLLYKSCIIVNMNIIYPLIVPCSTNPCDVNAACTNDGSAYSCSCKTGYTGTGRTCTGTNIIMHNQRNVRVLFRGGFVLHTLFSYCVCMP